MFHAALTQGWSGIALAYAAVQAPMIAGLIRTRAQLHHYLVSPVLAAPLTAAVAVGAAVSSAWLGHFGIGPHGWMRLTVGIGLSAALGYAGGEALARGAPDHKSHQRGSLV